MVGSAAFFDLDKTIIAKSSTLAFGRPLYRGGLINRRTVLRTAYAQFMFSIAGADADQMSKMRDYIAAMCTGWDVAQVREIVAEALHEIIDPLVYDEAVGLIEHHHAAGRDVVLVSSSGEEMVTPIGDMVGITDVIATRMVEQDGKYTGEIDFYAYGPNKAMAARELAQRRGYDLAGCYAYSDSATDVPLLEAVGHPVAVNPDRALRRIATERGWPILTFSRAVPARQRLHAPRPHVTIAMAGAAASVAGLTWWAVARAARASSPQSGAAYRPPLQRLADRQRLDRAGRNRARVMPDPRR